ncbi:hypothetical protein V6N13_070862 [Hibiscus sabdariffa]
MLSLSSSSLPHALPLVSPGGRSPDDPVPRDKSMMDGHSPLPGVALENRILPSNEVQALSMVDLVGIDRSTHNSSEDASDEVMVDSNTATGKTDNGPSRVSYAGMVRRNPNVSGKKAAASWEWNADDVEDNCVGSGGFPDVSANDKGKNLDHASSSTYPVEPSELAPYGPWMTVDNRRCKPLRGSAVANSGPRLAPLRVKEGVLMQRRGGSVTKQVSSDVPGDHMPMQGHKATMKGGTKQTKVAQDLPSTGSRFAALRMEDGASFMESDVEETGYVPRSVNVGTTTSGEVQVINSEKQPAQGSSIAIENGDLDGSEKNAEQLEELSISDVSIGKKETAEQVKEMPAMEVSVGSKHHVGNVKVVPILADHVVEILS